MEAIHKTRVRDFFLYFLAIITLYTSVWGFIDLLFEYINKLFPDSLFHGSFFSEGSLRTSLALLVIMFPVYLGVTWFLRKDIIRSPEKRDFIFRKIFLNFTLFVAALTIIIDLVTLVNNFLQGELTVHFFLKVFVVFLVAGAVFAYYLWDLRRETLPTSQPSRLLAIIAATIVGISIMGGFFVIESPFLHRLRRLDEQRISDLQLTHTYLFNYWQQYNALPRSLPHFEEDTPLVVLPRDPETGAYFEYKTIDERTFELCASFALATMEKEERRPYYFSDPALLTFETNWEHGKGRTCFPFRFTSEKIDQSPPRQKPLF